MDVPAQLDELGTLLTGVVGGIRPDQLDNPTPCAAFAVRGVLWYHTPAIRTCSARARFAHSRLQ